MIRLTVSAITVMVFCTIARASSYYVSPLGNDANAGSIDQPWLTIQRAANTLAPGDTVYVRDGIYNEAVAVNVSGSPTGGLISFVNFPNESPVIDGGTLTPPSNDFSGLFYIRDRSYIVVQGFELRNFRETTGRGAPSGIHVEGASHDIRIRGNNIHGIEFDTANGNAFGISIYGTSKAQPITNLVIDGNEVHHLKTGNSESLVLNGNVTNFAVTNNRVHDNNNIGIDFIGFEKTCPDPKQDQARDGVCRNNVVWNISSLTNPAYRGDTSATGIYCDGAARVLIERNVISLCDYGAELSSEHSGRTSRDCVFRDNFVFWCRHPGLSLGGYAARNTGGTYHCTVTGNTFFQNNTSDQGDGEIMFQFRVFNCVLKNNILVAGPSGLLISNATPARNTSGDVLDYNLYFSPLGVDGSMWVWKNRQNDGFAAWKNASRQDVHSIFADPKLVDTGTPDLHIQAGSPAIDAGDPALLPAEGETDIDGGARLDAGNMDIGADEL